MNKYICKRCGYKATQKQNLKNHLQKKKECESLYENISREILLKELEKKITTLNCNKCNKIFSSRQSKWTHEQNCKYNKDINEELKELKEMLNKVIETQNKQELIGNNNTLINSNNTNNNIINNTIIVTDLRPFGEENYDYICEDMIKRNLRPSKNLLLKLFKLIHFNRNHPENWNFYISNLTKNKALVYRGKRFEVEDKNTTIIELLSNKIKFLENFIKDLEGIPEIEKEIVIEGINNYTDIYNEDYKYDIKELIDSITEYAYNKKEKLELLKKELDKKNKDDTKIILSS
jgi:hypothetical protein